MKWPRQLLPIGVVLVIVFGSDNKLEPIWTVVRDERPGRALHLQLVEQGEEIAPAERDLADEVITLAIKTEPH